MGSIWMRRSPCVHRLLLLRVHSLQREGMMASCGSRIMVYFANNKPGVNLVCSVQMYRCACRHIPELCTRLPGLQTAVFSQREEMMAGSSSGTLCAVKRLCCMYNLTLRCWL